MTNDSPESSEPAESTVSSKPWKMACLLICWMTVVSAGMLGLAQYSQGRGEGLPPPNAQSIGLSVSPTGHTLVMSVHPKCPCTRASVYELERLMNRCKGKINLTFLVFEPTDADSSWNERDPFSLSSRFPGASIVHDLDGQTAGRLGSLTSGAVVLFDPAGQPVFWGGITSGRGHAGDNLGSDAILDLIRGRTPKNLSTPVYGCSLTNLVATDKPADSSRNQSCPASGACHE